MYACLGVTTNLPSVRRAAPHLLAPSPLLLSCKTVERTCRCDVQVEALQKRVVDAEASLGRAEVCASGPHFPPPPTMCRAHAHGRLSWCCRRVNLLRRLPVSVSVSSWCGRVMDCRPGGDASPLRACYRAGHHAFLRARGTGGDRSCSRRSGGRPELRRGARARLPGNRVTGVPGTVPTLAPAPACFVCLKCQCRSRPVSPCMCLHDVGAQEQARRAAEAEAAHKRAEVCVCCGRWPVKRQSQLVRARPQHSAHVSCSPVCTRSHQCASLRVNKQWIALVRAHALLYVHALQRRASRPR